MRNFLKQLARFWLLLVIVWGIEAMLNQGSNKHEPAPGRPSNPVKPGHGGASGTPSPEHAVGVVGVTGNDLQSAYDKIVNSLPDGVHVSFAEFQQKVGADAQLLPAGKIVTVTRQGSHITIDSDSDTSQQFGKVKFEQAQLVEFDLSAQAGVLTLTNIKGLRVSVAGAAALDLKEATISTDGNGNTTIQGRLLLWRWVPYIPFKVTLGPDGQPVP